MSIQRWKVVDTLGRYAETGDDGEWVMYADYVAAVQESQAWHYKRGAEDERARIKALVASLEYDGDYCKVLHSCDLLTAIDGKQA